MKEKYQALIIGCGAVGSLIGSALERSTGALVEVLYKPGNIPTRSIHYTNGASEATSFTHSTKTKKYDVIVVATKARDTSAAHRQAQNLLQTDGSIITIQSGIHDYDIPSKNHAKAVAYVNAYKDENGVVNMLSSQLRLNIENNLNQDIYDCLHNEYMDIHQSGEIDQLIRKKLIHIASFSGTICLHNCDLNTMRTTPSFFKNYLGVLEELLHLAQMNSFSFESNDFLQQISRTPGDTFTSLYHDLQSGKPGEFDAILGRWYRLARRYQLSTPYLDSMYETLLTSYAFLEHHHYDYTSSHG